MILNKRGVFDKLLIGITVFITIFILLSVYIVLVFNARIFNAPQSMEISPISKFNYNINPLLERIRVEKFGQTISLLSLIMQNLNGKITDYELTQIISEAFKDNKKCLLLGYGDSANPLKKSLDGKRNIFSVYLFYDEKSELVSTRRLTYPILDRYSNFINSVSFRYIKENVEKEIYIDYYQGECKSE